MKTHTLLATCLVAALTIATTMKGNANALTITNLRATSDGFFCEIVNNTPNTIDGTIAPIDDIIIEIPGLTDTSYITGGLGFDEFTASKPYIDDNNRIVTKFSSWTGIQMKENDDKEFVIYIDRDKFLLDYGIDYGTFVNTIMPETTFNIFFCGTSIPGIGVEQFTIGKVATTEPVPEPATLFLLGFGLFGIAGYKRKTSE